MLYTGNPEWDEDSKPDSEGQTIAERIAQDGAEVKMRGRGVISFDTSPTKRELLNEVILKIARLAGRKNERADILAHFERRNGARASDILAEIVNGEHIGE